jgi:SET domain-containing protein
VFPPLDGTALYATHCKINHSCDPNVIVKYNSCEDRGLIAELHALKDILAGEELVQSYIDQSMGE